MIPAALAALLLLTTPVADDDEEGSSAPKLELPRCSSGATADEAGLMRSLEQRGLKLESVHSHPGGGSEITYSGGGLWVRLLGDGGLACAIAAGRDEETSA